GSRPAADPSGHGVASRMGEHQGQMHRGSSVTRNPQAGQIVGRIDIFRDPTAPDGYLRIAAEYPMRVGSDHVPPPNQALAKTSWGRWADEKGKKGWVFVFANFRGRRHPWDSSALHFTEEGELVRHLGSLNRGHSLHAYLDDVGVWRSYLVD